MANFDYEHLPDNHEISADVLTWRGNTKNRAFYFGFYKDSLNPVFLLRFWGGVLELFEVSYANRAGYWNVGAYPDFKASDLHEYLRLVSRAISAGNVSTLVLPCMLSREVKAQNRNSEQPKDRLYLEIG
jgi:hypothetical protein